MSPAAEVACSIVMAVYNKAAELSLVLTSIFRQAPPFRFEVIVVDDGSEDRTREVCGRFPVRYEHLERAYYTNPAHARNQAFRLAQGAIVINQSAEVVHHGERVIESLSARVNRGNFVIGAVVNVDAQGDLMAQTHHGGSLTAVDFRRPLFFLGAVLREHVIAIGGDAEDFVHPGYEDQWFSECLIGQRGLRPEYTPEVMGLHYDHDRNSTYSHATYCQMRNLFDMKKAAVRRGYTRYSGTGLGTPDVAGQ